MLIRIFIFLSFLFGVKSSDLTDSELASAGPDVVFAVNSGGKEHVDIDGIHYDADTLSSGIGSDYGTRWIIRGISQADMILYQTERYGLDNDFSYEFRLPEPGDYVLVMKFCEVYFQSPNQKIFDVILNGHIILSEFDIFAISGGRAVAYDVITPIQITPEHMIINEQLVDLNNGVFKLTLSKGAHDNPKINAFYLKRGTWENLHGIAQRHRILNNEFNQETIVDIDEHHDEQPPFEQEDQDVSEDSHTKFASGPAAPNPYEGQDVSNLYLPIVVTVILIIPVVFCLIKM